MTLLAVYGSVVTRQDNTFTGTLIFLGLAFPFIALAWDGLIRRQLLLPAFPVGAALGSQAVQVRRLGSIAIGLVCLLAAAFSLLFAWGFLRLGVARTCPGRDALTCAGPLLGSAEVFSWAWLGLCLGWFVIVWLRMGDPRRRVLVYGVWYRQDKVARAITRQLQERGLPSLPQARVYALEEDVLRLMRARGWLVFGDASLDGGQQRTAVAVAPETMVDRILQDPMFADAGEAERVAIEYLLGYFHVQAQRAQHLSPMRRWWVGSSQRGRLGVYGRRAV